MTAYLLNQKLDGIELVNTAQEGNRLVSYRDTAAKIVSNLFDILWAQDCHRRSLDPKPLEALTFFHVQHFSPVLPVYHSTTTS